MSIENTDVVDFISAGACGDVELTISDDLDWADTERHIELLQKKIYRYLDFIESGELYQSNAAVAGSRVVIRVRAKFSSPDHRATEFFNFIRAVVEERGVAFVSGQSSDRVTDDGDKLAYFEPRVMRHHIDERRCEYAIHDVFFDADGNVQTFTSAARSNRFSSVAELKAWILEMLPQAQNGITCGDLGYSHSVDHLSHWLTHIDDPVIDYKKE